jgi:hypothetical protein
LKRQEKSEAKQARKANVKRAAKWTEERRALDKLKKIANKPRKDERKRQRMLKRADKLEEQAKKLHIEAQKARARFAYLTKIKEVSLRWVLTACESEAYADTSGLRRKKQRRPRSWLKGRRNERPKPMTTFR